MFGCYAKSYTAGNEHPEHGMTSWHQGKMSPIKHKDFVRPLYRRNFAYNVESFKQVSIERSLQVQKFSKKSAKRYGYSKHITYPRYRQPGARRWLKCQYFHNLIKYAPHKKQWKREITPKILMQELYALSMMPPLIILCEMWNAHSHDICENIDHIPIETNN